MAYGLRMRGIQGVLAVWMAVLAAGFWASAGGSAEAACDFTSFWSGGCNK